MIELKNLSFAYRKAEPLFAGLSIGFERGHIYGLLGANGTGKSTLLRLVCGMLTPDAGRAKIDGQTVSKRPLELCRRIFVVPEEFELPRLSFEEFARCTAPFHADFSADDFGRYCSDFGVDMSKNIHSLSMGQRKKGYLAFALACHTDILLLDEPTNGLDIPSKTVFRRLLAEYASEERTIIIATHQVKEIELLLDRVIVIDSEGLVLNASTATISERLLFTTASSAEGAIYFERSVEGYRTVRENLSGAETPIDLELLFNAATADRTQISRIINTQSHE